MLRYARTLAMTGAIATVFLTSCESLELNSPIVPTFNIRLGQSPIDVSPPQSSSTVDMEAQVREQINEIRQQQGLEPLSYSEELTQVARDYSQRMATEAFFDHISPTGDSPADRVTSAGIFYLAVGENLFMGTNLPEPVAMAVQGWMDSPGHRDNILREEYRETGVGVWQQGNTYYFTQLFMRSL